jgi:hypothetical protein
MEGTMGWFEDAQAEILRFTPKEGFNVVGVDSFEMPGEALYLVGHYATRKEALAAARAHEASSCDRAHVYAPLPPPKAPKPAKVAKVAKPGGGAKRPRARAAKPPGGEA